MNDKKKLLKLRAFLNEKLSYYDAKIKDSSDQDEQDYFTMKFITYTEVLSQLD